MIAEYLAWGREASCPSTATPSGCSNHMMMGSQRSTAKSSVAKSSEWKAPERTKKTSRALPDSLKLCVSKTKRIKAVLLLGTSFSQTARPWKSEKSLSRNTNKWEDSTTETIKTAKANAQCCLASSNSISVLFGSGPVLIQSSSRIQWFLLVKSFRPFKTINRLLPWSISSSDPGFNVATVQPSLWWHSSTAALCDCLLWAAGKGLRWCHTLWLPTQTCLAANNSSLFRFCYD